MKDKFARTVEDVLRWIDSHAHYEMTWLFNGYAIRGEETHFRLDGDDESLLIPKRLKDRAAGLIEIVSRNVDPHHIFRLTDEGFHYLVMQEKSHG